ncbi:MAG: aminopeptidase P family protein [Chloroflexota bacterium]|nr:MAG: aminopeptidase P family protein [Chloroflexota bacterium]
MSASLSSVDYDLRQQRLAQAMKIAQLEGMALNAGPSLTYLTGLHFHLSERPVLGLFSAGNPPVIVLPELETGKISNLAYQTSSFAYGEDPETWQTIMKEGIQAAGFSGRRIGIEPRVLRVLELDLLNSTGIEFTLVSGEAALAQLRMQKDEYEQARMQKAVDIAQNALDAILPEIKPGITERELAAKLVIALLNYGSDPQLPFSPIVASGPNSAKPHAFPTDRQLIKGDLLIIDWGANEGGYFSDLTRTFAIGDPQQEMVEIAQIVLEANQAARSKARPGVSAQEVDQAARAVIEAAGYGDYFTHRTGHGLGMEGHEAPYIRAGNPILLTPGMTFTIEPGIYLSGKGGVRIEDDVVITEEGLYSFSDLPRELKILGS